MMDKNCFHEEDKLYCYPGTMVLKNKLGIHDENKLEAAEGAIVTLRVAELFKDGIKGRFDFRHLKSIHYYLFHDVYEWAGKERFVDMAKGHIFCPYQNIDEQAKIIFEDLREQNYFLDYDYNKTMNSLIKLFTEINALHPFREGNGRTQREFTEELAKINGICLDLTKIRKDEMIEASFKAINNDYEMLTRLFLENAEEKLEKKEEWQDKYMEEMLYIRCHVKKKSHWYDVNPKW